MHIHISWWKAFYDIYLHFEKNFWCYITIYIRTHIFWHFHDTYLYTYIHFARHFHDMHPHVYIFVWKVFFLFYLLTSWAAFLWLIYMHFARHFHDSICIHFARHFLQPTYHTYIYFCYLHTCILFCKGFLLTISIFERNFPTYSHFLKSIYIFFAICPHFIHIYFVFLKRHFHAIYSRIYTFI